jgi:hypothetical protein
MYPKPIAHNIGTDEYIWVWGEGQQAGAVISRRPPSGKTPTRQLIALVSHLDLDEWVAFIEKFDPDQPRYPKGHPAGGQWRSINPDQISMFPPDPDSELAEQKRIAQDVKDRRQYENVRHEEIERREQNLWNAYYYDQDLTAEDADADFMSADEWLKKSLQNTEVRVSVHGDDTLNKILDDGRLKSQFESGGSRGMFDPNYRRAMEYSLFGIGGNPDDDDDETTLSDQARPIYGFLSRAHDRAYKDTTNANVTRQYGAIQMVLDKSVRTRTTFTGSDSLQIDWDTDESRFLPSSINNPSLASVTPVSPYYTGMGERTGSDDLYKLARVARDTDISPNVNNLRDAIGGDYIEAQVHGGVSVSDIVKVRIPRNEEPYTIHVKDSTLARLKEAGIEVEYYGDD